MKIKILILFLLVPAGLLAQDFYNFGNTLKFGKYLYQTRQFEYAGKEFERCHFLDPGHSETNYFLLKVYRQLGEYEKGIQLTSSGKFAWNDSTGNEYFRLLVQAGKYREGEDFLRNGTHPGNRPDLRMSAILLQKEWKRGNAFLDSNRTQIDKLLATIAEKSTTTRRKSPFLAGAMSALIPGTGKVYAGRWKDGLVSFLMTATAGFATVRGYNRNNQSVYPWVMASFFTFYYTGNIYGSVRAATGYNKKLEDEWSGQVRDFVLHD